LNRLRRHVNVYPNRLDVSSITSVSTQSRKEVKDWNARNGFWRESGARNP
jgi:hypothetical protein